MHLKVFQKESFQTIAEVTGDLIGNQIANRITKFSRTSPQIISENNSLS